MRGVSAFIHHVHSVLALLTLYCSGHCYEFLLPYSPDFNPIEPAFSAIKAHIRHHGGLFRAATESQGDKRAVLLQLHKAVFSVMLTDADGWFRHCGYM